MRSFHPGHARLTSGARKLGDSRPSCMAALISSTKLLMPQARSQSLFGSLNHRDPLSQLARDRKDGSSTLVRTHGSSRWRSGYQLRSNPHSRLLPAGNDGPSMTWLAEQAIARAGVVPPAHVRMNHRPGVLLELACGRGFR